MLTDRNEKLQILWVATKFGAKSRHSSMALILLNRCHTFLREGSMGNLVRSTVLGILLVAASSPASAAIRTVSSCNAVDVQAAINLSVSGDTIALPAGTCTWSGSVEPIYVAGKDLVLKGAGPELTKITLTTYGTAINLTTTASRVTGFGFTIPSTSDADSMILARGQGWRVDHNTFTSAHGTMKVVLFAAGVEFSAIAPPTGLFDHNTMDGKLRVLAFDQTDLCHQDWARTLTLGTSNAVYVEDNSFRRASISVNAIDSSACGRYVFRFNQVSNSSVEVHSIQGNHRGPRLWEIYGNTIQTDSGWFSAMFIRGGTGVAFQNLITGPFSDSIVFDNVRSDHSPSSPPGKCDGTSPWDGNLGTGIEAGWPCRDQIGRSTDLSLWTIASPYPRQSSAPVYVWGNSLNGAKSAPSVAPNSQHHIKPNRDYYTDVAAVDGSIGVTSGTLASRPATCSVGASYWVTDRGSWNTKLPANTSGELHKCTSPNVWTVHYVPYRYPHPLSGTAPAAPTNFKVVG
jgi:hypothetical protein